MNKSNNIQILTDAEVNTENFSPEVVQCCPRAEGKEGDTAEKKISGQLNYVRAWFGLYAIQRWYGKSSCKGRAVWTMMCDRQTTERWTKTKDNTGPTVCV